MTVLFFYLFLRVVVYIFISFNQIDKNFTASCESRVTSLAIAVFLKYNSGEFLFALQYT
jgi:hypothetical protein